MAAFPGMAEQRSEDLRPHQPALELFARIEGLLGEETALLNVPAGERDGKQRARLREIGEELDRIWEALRDRADRLGERIHPHQQRL
jgi:hypothetical protein